MNDFYVIIENVYNEYNDIEVLHITNDYTEAIEFFHNSYNVYIEDNMYITREVKQGFVLIYKRNIGMLWNSKTPFRSFKICKCSKNNNFVSV